MAYNETPLNEKDTVMNKIKTLAQKPVVKFAVIVATNVVVAVGAQIAVSKLADKVLEDN